MIQSIETSKEKIRQIRASIRFFNGRCSLFKEENEIQSMRLNLNKIWEQFRELYQHYQDQKVSRYSPAYVEQLERENKLLSNENKMLWNENKHLRKNKR